MMKQVLWISRHRMTPEQLEDLEAVLQDSVTLLPWTDTVREVEEITGIPAGKPVEELCFIEDGFRGRGWGANTSESAKEIFSFARAEGIFIENIYNSKVLVGMRDWLEKGKTEGPVCYLHTGGFGSLFAQY